MPRVKMHATHYSSMLPELFKHKTTKVRVPQPKVILMDFHGTISERRWEDKVIYPYVKQALGGYLQTNWANETVQRCLPILRDESFEQRFRNKFDDAPVISDPVNGEDEADQSQLATQMSDFLLWQMESKKETGETQLIERLVWRDGLSRKQIATPIYEDVFASVRDWYEKCGCAMYVVSSLDADTLRLLFENTDRGNLSQFLKGFVTPRKPGEKLNSELYRNFCERLHIDPKKSPGGGNNGRISSQSSQSASMAPPPHLDGSNSKVMSSFESVTRPILFLTDSGQEARAANQVHEGSLFECILVNRPGNKRIRTYYLSQFPYIERFDDLAFVR